MSQIITHLFQPQTILRIAVALILVSSSVLSTYAQEGTISRETIRARSLENNVTGESIERGVSIYLPPGYETSSKRYPVIYLLHGIGDNDQNWTRSWSTGHEGYATIQDVMNKGIFQQRFGEMIIVMPDERTKSLGSFYVNSASTGNWDDFTSTELVDYIDKKYRTLASPHYS
jgi:S-formylglutathione hydrolase FrmB